MGNVIKNNHIIDKYNKWYETEEQNNFNINFSTIPFSNDIINYERSIIRYPINNILHNIFNISNLENINNSSELDEDNKILDQEKESGTFEESKEFAESGENNIELNNQENSLENIINTIDNYFKNCHNNNLEEQNINDELFQENNTLIPIEEDYSDLPDLINVSYDFPSILNYYLEEDIIIALNDEEFDKLDKIKYKEDTIEKTNKECLICLDNFMEDDEIIKIKCNHIFHTNCIKHWLCKESNKCPICRIEVGKGLPINI